MELALAAWPDLPADSHDPLKVDRRISDKLIDAAAPRTPFRVVWWRVVEALGYIPHSDESERIVPVKIYRKRCTTGRYGNKVPPYWQEVDPPAAAAGALDHSSSSSSNSSNSKNSNNSKNSSKNSSNSGGAGAGVAQVDAITLNCRVTMSVAEAHSLIRSADIGEGLKMRRGYTYNEIDGLAIDLEFFSHRWIRPWYVHNTHKYPYIYHWFLGYYCDLYWALVGGLGRAVIKLQVKNDDFVFKTMDFVFKMMYFVFKMMYFVFKILTSC